MKIVIYLLISILSAVSCKQVDTGKKSDAKIIENKIEEVLDNLKKDLYDSVEVNFDQKEESLVDVEIAFNKKNVVHLEHQKSILSYLIYEIDFFNKYDTIVFDYFVEGEEQSNSNRLELNKKQVSDLKDIFKSEMFLELMEFSLKNFNVDTIFNLDVWVKNAWAKYPNDVLRVDFIGLLEKLSRECNGESSKKDAKATIVLLYIAIKHHIANSDIDLESQIHTKKILEDYWKICSRGEKIEFAEQRLFGKVDGNWN